MFNRKEQRNGQGEIRQRLPGQGGNTRAYEIPPPRLRGVGEGARLCEKAHGPIVEIRVELWKGLEVEMSENLAEQVIRPSYEQTVGSIRHSGVQELLRRAQQVEDEITEQRSIVVTAHVQSGVS